MCSREDALAGDAGEGSRMAFSVAAKGVDLSRKNGQSTQNGRTGRAKKATATGSSSSRIRKSGDAASGRDSENTQRGIKMERKYHNPSEVNLEKVVMVFGVSSQKT